MGTGHFLDFGRHFLTFLGKSVRVRLFLGGLRGGFRWFTLFCFRWFYVVLGGFKWFFGGSSTFKFP